MRHRASAVLVVLALVHAAPAQGDFIIYPERRGNCTTFVDRMQTSQIEALQGVHRENFAGVGDLGGTCSIRAIYHWAVDENPSTTETYHLVIRGQNPTNMDPDVSATGLLARVGPFTSPPNPTTQRSTFFVTDTFATPLTVPCQDGFFLGVDLPAAPNWPASDGHGVWVAWYAPPPVSPLGENPRVGAPNTTFGVTNGTTIFRPPNAFVFRIGALVGSPVLNVGGIDPSNTRQTVGRANYGAGGLYPDISGIPRSDGIELRIEDTGSPGGLAAAFFAASLTTIGPVAVPSVLGQLWLDPLTLSPLGTTRLDGSGMGVVPVAPPGSIPPVFQRASVAFQALTVDAAFQTVKFTNLQLSHL